MVMNVRDAACRRINMNEVYVVCRHDVLLYSIF
jgi:hypothetical protein